jgi:hypothetical protein
MLYNNPVTSNVDMSARFVAKLTAAFDNVRYIKEASMDVGRVFDIVEETKGVMNVFAGERPVESFLLGAVGYVNPFGNYIPYETARRPVVSKRRSRFSRLRIKSITSLPQGTRPMAISATPKRLPPLQAIRWETCVRPSRSFRSWVAKGPQESIRSCRS